MSDSIPPPPPPPSFSEAPVFSVTNLCDLIAPNLYLGSIEAVYSTDLLNKLKITHILTVEDNQIDDRISGQYVYKFKQLADYQHCDLLEILDECFEFIDQAVENSNNILIHWYIKETISFSDFH